jgi:hypothetical protein
LVVPERIDPPAIAALEALLGLPEAVETLDTLALPDAPEPRVLVAADRVVRRQAADGGWLAVAHPMLALPTCSATDSRSRASPVRGNRFAGPGWRPSESRTTGFTRGLRPSSSARTPSPTRPASRTRTTSATPTR